MEEAKFSKKEMANFMLGHGVSEDFQKEVYKIVMREEYHRTNFDNFSKMFFGSNAGVTEVVRKHLMKKLDNGFIKSLFHMRGFINEEAVETELQKPHSTFEMKPFSKDEGYDLFNEVMLKWN